MQMLQFLFYYYYIKERCGRGQGAEATHDSHWHTLNQNQSSIIIQVMTNYTLLPLGKRHLMETRIGLRVAVYWWLIASANSRKRGSPGVLV
jgi:hypothetical protein